MERAVIDEELIRRAVLDERKRVSSGPGHSNSADDADPIIDDHVDLDEIQTLMLSFHNICKIDNLQGFESITKLQLDNNVIERIENLDHLVNLTWLDLSFNNIEKIENLEMLTKLTDLSLFHNNISVIENLDTLSNLNVLSLGNNNITDVDNLMYLRKFKNLRLLNLAGCPVCDEDDYKTTVLAYLNNLTYLDYARTEKTHVLKAKEEKQAQLLELEEVEKVKEQETMEEMKKRERRQNLAKANLQGIETMFDEMIQEDHEIKKLKLLPGFKEILNGFRDNAEKATAEFVEQMMVENVSKGSEVELFEKVLKKVQHEHEKESIELIRIFEKVKKAKLHEFRSGLEGSEPDGGIVVSMNEFVMKLSDDLMDHEMQCTEKVSDCINEFETQYLHITKRCTDIITNFFHDAEELEKIYWEDVTTLAHNLLEKHQAEPVENPVLAPLLSEREALESSISNSHSSHLERILKTGDEILEREAKSTEKIASASREREYRRNRQRVADIFDIYELHQNDINSLTSDM